MSMVNQSLFLGSQFLLHLLNSPDIPYHGNSRKVFLIIFELIHVDQEVLDRECNADRNK